MKGITIELIDGTFDGNITMKSDSKIIAARVNKKDKKIYKEYLNGKGIYFLLIDNNSIYVGQTSFDVLDKRIQNSHRNDIQKKWHTVIAFKCLDNSMSSDELGYIENAMCEYVHENTDYVNLTINPEQLICNAKYRIEHFTSINVHNRKLCDGYIDDIKKYLECFPYSLFPRINSVSPVIEEKKPANKNKHKSVSENGNLFYYRNMKRDAYGDAEIQINGGNVKSQKIILRKGARISDHEVSESFKKRCPGIIEKRNELTKSKKIKNGLLMEDLIFDTPTAAAEFMSGTCISGNAEWKRKIDNKPLKDCLEQKPKSKPSKSVSKKRK